MFANMLDMLQYLHFPSGVVALRGIHVQGFDFCSALAIPALSVWCSRPSGSPFSELLLFCSECSERSERSEHGPRSRKNVPGQHRVHQRLELGQAKWWPQA